MKPQTKSNTRPSSKPRKKTRNKAQKAEVPETDLAPANDEAIVVKGARAHNLKNVHVTIPRNKLVVITGPSGSGKSSLAFDTIYAEGQRRYVESLSAYARQFLDQMTKPEVESVSGLSPTISIEQGTTSHNPRSTVGTVTEIYDFFRLLYARIGKPFCYKCGSAIKSQSPQQITDTILALDDETKVSILAPVARDRKGEYQREIINLRQQGFVRARIDGDIVDLSEDITLDKHKRHTIEVYVDRLILRGDRAQLASRVSDSVELCLRLGMGLLILETNFKNQTTERLLSEKFACLKCDVHYPEPEPRSFSFNSPMGACPSCDGLGTKDFQLEELETEDPADSQQALYASLKKVTPCVDCLGARLRIESRHFKIEGLNIFDTCTKPISELELYLATLKLSARDTKIAERILKEIGSRLSFLNRVGVGYLDLNRSAQTLSGGESQRIKLATQIGSSLVGVIYVLDEPSIGLHPKDHDKLLETLFKLRDMGNSVLVVEHDRETIERADWIVDLGPGAGVNGGHVVSEGPLETILKDSASLTGRYLRGTSRIEMPSKRRPLDFKKAISIKGATQNNLKNIDVTFPLGTFICVTGVSGSGKSTLVLDTLFRLAAQKLYRADVGEVQIKSSTGLDLIDKVIDIDQSPIGRTPRSNPATYTGLFGLIRDLYAQLPESKIRGFKPGRFSFNVKGGRCETCEGAGVTRIEMHFLPDVFVKCETCNGRRYNRETLEIRYKGKNIAEALNMTVAEALPFFESLYTLKQKLTVLNEVGLGYITLGQRATTLSGGEAQRIKLSKELSRRSTGKTLYILDEPTTGLHFDDVGKLIQILQTLVDQGNTVLVIEHNLDLIKVADYIIDVGPSGGGAGGLIIGKGTPEEVAGLKGNSTGDFLRPYLEKNSAQASA